MATVFPCRPVLFGLMADEQEGIDYPRGTMPGAPPVIESERRNKWTWFVLGAVFLFLIAGSLKSYFSPEHEEAAAASGNEVLQMKLMVAMQEAVRSLAEQSDPASRKAFEKNFEQLRDSNRQTAKKLEDQKKLTTEEARELLALNQESGDAPNKRALDVLGNSKKASDQDIATIYESKSLDPAEAEALAPKGKDFLDRMAAAHAREKAGIKDARKGLVNVGLGLGLFAGMFAALGFLVVGTIVLIFHFAAVNAGAQPKGLPVNAMTKATADRFALRMALYLATFVGVSIVTHYIPLPFDAMVNQVIGLALVAVLVFVMLNTPLLGARDSWKSIAGQKPKQGIIGPALAGWVSNAPVMLAMVLISTVLIRFLPTPSHPVQQEIASTTDPLKLGMIFLLASVFAPLIEETTFRGLLFPAITTVANNKWVGMIVSGILFAAIHPQGPALWPALAALGALMAYLTNWTGSIVPGMVLHGLHNGTILAFSLILNSL